MLTVHYTLRVGQQLLRLCQWQMTVLLLLLLLLLLLQGFAAIDAGRCSSRQSHFCYTHG
jgi:hypothetical protein